MANIKLRSVIFAIILTSCFCSTSPAEPTPREPSARQQAIAERRQQFEQEASAAGPEIDAQYAKFVSYVNSGKAPDDANVRDGLKFITKYRRYLPILLKQNNGGTYYALTAWVMHFDGKPDRVQKQIASGIKDKAINANFLRTAVALSIVNKDFDTIEQISSLMPTPESTDAVVQDYSSSTPSEGSLNFDVNSINLSLLGKDFSAFAPGKDKVIISALLWQVDANELEHYAPPTPKAEEPNKPNDPNNPEQLMEQPPAEEQQFTPVPMPDLTAFTNLNNKFNKNPKAVFLGINFNDPSKSKHVENWLAKNTQAWQCVAPSETVQQVATAMIGRVPQKPMLVIAGPDMKIRYVGDVNNILPAMIIKNILDNPQEFAEPNEANEPNKPAAASDVNTQTKMEILKPAPQDESIKTEPSTPNTTPAATEAKPQLPQTLNNEEGEYTEVDADAQQKLSYAEQLLKIANQMYAHSYRKPVEICRGIIEKYPNTKYAEQARVLLRRVPERFRKNYNLTDAELGL
jgi:hypothetical protein